MKKRLILSLALLVFSAHCASVYAAQENDKSIGTSAGETARSFTEQTNETVKVASVETEKASKQFTQIMDEALQKLSAQFQAATRSFQAASQEFSKKLQEELEKFKQAYNKPK